MKKCTKCGRSIRDGFTLCFSCYQEQAQVDAFHEYNQMSEQEKEDERESYYLTECDMCGKEGASPREDGKNYCLMCWTNWNS